MALAKVHKLKGDNPFVEITPTWWLVLACYILLYEMMVPAWEMIFYDPNPMTTLRLFSFWSFVLLKYAPILFYVRGKMGWLHPLILPPLFILAKDLGKDPLEIFTAFQYQPLPLEYDPVLPDHDAVGLAWLRIKGNFIKDLGLVCYYLGYLVITRFKVPKVTFNRPQWLKPKLLFIACLGLFFAGLVVYKTGGIAQNILMLARGRFRYREAIGGGHFLVLATLLSVACYLWIAYFKEGVRRPMFWGLLLLSLGSSFILTGSRTTLMVQLMTVGLIYIAQTHRIPSKIMLLGLVAGVLVMGPLGQLRQAGWNTEELRWEEFFSTDIEENFSATRAELSSRPDGYRVVLGKAIEEEGMLWGRTYLSALLFWVPRAIWAAKPRGAGAYNGNLLFGDLSLAEMEANGGKGMGVPTGAEGEAYWNFYYPGVVLVFFFFGVLVKFLTSFFRTYHAVPAVVVLYVMALTNLVPVSIQMVAFFQKFCLLLFAFVLCGIWYPFRFNFRK